MLQRQGFEFAVVGEVVALEDGLVNVDVVRGKPLLVLTGEVEEQERRAGSNSFLRWVARKGEQERPQTEWLATKFGRICSGGIGGQLLRGSCSTP